MTISNVIIIELIDSRLHWFFTGAQTFPGGGE